MSQIFDSNFVDAIRSQLETLGQGEYLPRKKICEKLGLESFHDQTLSVMYRMGLFPGFEAVTSRGFRRLKKESTAS